MDTPTDQGGGSWEPESAFFTAEEAGGGDEGESSVYFGMSEEFGGDVSAGRNMNMAHMGMSNITEEGVRQVGFQNPGMFEASSMNWATPEIASPLQEGEDADEGEEESLPLHRLLTNASLSAGLLSGGSWAGVQSSPDIYRPAAFHFILPSGSFVMLWLGASVLQVLHTGGSVLPLRCPRCGRCEVFMWAANH